jgi:small subunit ribosomal protein S20
MELSLWPGQRQPPPNVLPSLPRRILEEPPILKGYRSGQCSRRGYRGDESLPNTKSAIKQVKVQERRRLRNKSVRSATRTYLKKAETAIKAGEVEPSSETVRQAIGALDRAARKGVIHRNAAARGKSRLMKKLNTQLAAGAQA